jgi:hypothetical protein
MPKLPDEVNLRMLQEIIGNSAQAFFGKLDKTLNPSVFFAAISPDVFSVNSYSSEASSRYLQVIGSEDELKATHNVFQYFFAEHAEAEKEVLKWKSWYSSSFENVDNDTFIVLCWVG